MTPIDRYSYFPILDYLPLSDTERKVFSMVLTFADRKESKRTGKGLCLSNAGIGQVINRSGHTVKKAITTLRQKGLIVADKEKSRHRIIWPGNAESYLTSLGGQVSDILLDHFRILLDQYSGHLLDQSGRSTEVKKEYKEKGNSFSAAVDSEPEPTHETTPAKEPPTPERMRAVMESLGFIKGQAI